MIQLERSSRLADAAMALRLLEGLGDYYPDFGHWYANKVMPGLLVGDDVLVRATDKGALIGVALGRKGARAKLRCVRVAPQYQSRGVGLRLVDRMLSELGTDKPHCTVPEEMLHQFSRPFVNHYHFSLDEVGKGMYRAGKLEYVFNAPIGGDSPGSEAYPELGPKVDPWADELFARAFDLPRRRQD